jgi:septal ring factor EnvC (AmiA/AmiB activator)
MIRWTDNFFRPYQVVTSDVSIFDKTVSLEKRIKKLEEENVELTNALYEVENRLQAQIDNIHPVVYNLKNENWHQ